MFKIGDLVTIRIDYSLNSNYEIERFMGVLLKVDALDKDNQITYVKVKTGDERVGSWWVADRFELAKSAIINQILSEL
jgi:ribosomal protein L21E